MLSRIQILALLLLIPCLLTAQVKDDTITTKNENRTELVITKPGYPKYKKVIRLKDNILDGLQEITSENGYRVESNYKNGFKDGDEFNYDYKGNLSGKRTYKYKKSENRSVLEGQEMRYEYKILVSDVTFKDSIRDGKAISYDYKGSLSQIVEFDRGLVVKEESYYDNGKLRSVSIFRIITENNQKKSVKHGRFVRYKADGSLYVTGKYKDDLQEGLWTEYHSNSPYKRTEIFYSKGNVNGKSYSYYDNGSPEKFATYYSSIKVGDTILKSVFDGSYRTFFKNGKPQEIKNYTMGKLNGSRQLYHQNGVLKEECKYKDNLIDGVYISYDDTGRKTSEKTYAIVQDEKKGLKSIKQGRELIWEKGILISDSYYENDKFHGLRLEYYGNGQLKDSVRMESGQKTGKGVSYFENGQVKSRNFYALKLLKNNKSPLGYQEGWQYEYDGKGNPLVFDYYDPLYTSKVSYKWTNGHREVYSIPKTLSVNYFPEGTLKSFFVEELPFSSIGIVYYRSGAIRKIMYQDAQTGQNAVALFTDDGKLLTMHDGAYPETKLPLKASIPLSYLNATDPAWWQSPLFTDFPKNGVYELRYTNQKVFLRMEFKDNLPEGEFLLLEPVKGDTLVHKHFSKGIIVGKEVINFAGIRPLKISEYYDTGQLKEKARYLSHGIQYEYNSYSEDGEHIVHRDYHDNGKPKSLTNFKDGSSESYNKDGIKISETLNIPGRPECKVSREWYNNGILKKEAYSYNNKLDSIYKTYHANGNLQRLRYYKEDNPSGDYKEYDEKGNLKREGQYVNEKMEGKWTAYSDGNAEVTLYEKGFPVVAPPTTKCGCVDTSTKKEIGYAPSLDNLLDWVSFKRRLPAFLKPVDSLHYDSIFYKDFQHSSGGRSAFTAMSLIAFDEFAFTIHSADKAYAKIILNPCRVKGYISPIPITVTFDYDMPEQTHGSITPKRISIELLNSPLHSGDKDYENYTALLDVSDISYDYDEDFTVYPAKNPNACLTAGAVKDFLTVNATSAKPFLIAKQRFPDDITFPGAEPRERFIGLEIDEGAVSFRYQNEIINGVISRIYAGSGCVTGKIHIPCKKTPDGNYNIKGNGTTVTMNVKILEELWEQNKFQQVSTQYLEKNEVLEIFFYTE